MQLRFWSYSGSCPWTWLPSCGSYGELPFPGGVIYFLKCSRLCPPPKSAVIGERLLKHAPGFEDGPARHSTPLPPSPAFPLSSAFRGRTPGDTDSGDAQQPGFGKPGCERSHVDGPAAALVTLQGGSPVRHEEQQDLSPWSSLAPLNPLHLPTGKQVLGRASERDDLSGGKGSFKLELEQKGAFAAAPPNFRSALSPRVLPDVAFVLPCTWNCAGSVPVNAAMEGSPSFRPSTRKSWIAVSMIELVIILILAAGLAHFATHPDRDLESWPDSSMLASLDRVNRTLQVATKRWESCQNQMRLLEANTSLLSSEMAQLNARLQLQELENRGLEDELTLLRNWTQLLQDLNNQQKALIGHFRYQQERLASHGRNLRLHSSLASLVLALMVAHWV